MKEKNKFKKINNSGFVALIYVLAVSAIVLILALSTVLISIEGLQISFWGSESAPALLAAESCLEDGLLKLKRNFVDYDYFLSVGENSCTIITETAGGQAEIKSLGVSGNYYREININIDSDFNIIDKKYY